MPYPKIRNAEELEAVTQELGILPFFANTLPHFSVEEFTPSRYWFADGVDGPWEWRMEVAKRGVVAYGKLFGKKAALVSREWYPDLANYRREGYDFDARYDDGLASRKDKVVVDLLTQNGPMLSKDLKRAAGFDTGFDTVITRLQMQTYITIHSFEYAMDKLGRPFGWGIARYALAEDVLGEDVTRAAYSRTPEESKARLLAQLTRVNPEAYDEELERFVR